MTQSTSDAERDPEVTAATDHADRLLSEVAELVHSLNGHLDEIQELIEDRRKVS